MDRQLFAARMREARKKQGIELKTLRELVGISQSAMSHYSTGTTIPPLTHAVKIAQRYTKTTTAKRFVLA